MGIKKYIALVILLISLLAITVASQISWGNNAVTIEEVKTCNTVSYDELQPVYGTCFYNFNYTSCLNTSGPNTNCFVTQAQINYTCKTGEVIVNKNKTDCQPPTKFIVSITKSSATEKKEIDFSDWGRCINNVENNCLVVTCVSLYDGAHRGQYIDCRGGKSCQRFKICDDKIKVYYKNSREDFVEEDPSFYLNKLAFREVGE